MSIIIHGVGKSRAVRNLWMAEELGLSYTHDQIDFRDGSASTAGYLAINDLAQVPSLTDGDFALTESLAINLYLAKRAGGPMAPRDLQEDALMMKWTLFAATQIEATSLTIMMHGAMLPEQKRDPQLLADSVSKVARPLAHLDKALARGKGFLVGGRFTAADVNVGGCVFYLRLRQDLLDRYPHIAAWWANIIARPAYQTAMKIRGD